MTRPWLSSLDSLAFLRADITWAAGIALLSVACASPPSAGQDAAREGGSLVDGATNPDGARDGASEASLDEVPTDALPVGDAFDAGPTDALPTGDAFDTGPTDAPAPVDAFDAGPIDAPALVDAPEVSVSDGPSSDTLVSRTCRGNGECGADEFCSRSRGNCASEGVCARRAVGCTTEVDPVCGCDGRTYTNACGASSAGVSIATTGECMSICSPARGCCRVDSDCGGRTEQCVGSASSCTGVCKTPPTSGCWRDDDCRAGLRCLDARICACGALCLLPDAPGRCG